MLTAPQLLACLIATVMIQLLAAEDTLNIFETLPAKEVVYFFTSKDSQNRTLDSSKGANYTVTFALPVPAFGFWSLTIYNLTSLLLFQNPIDRYAIGDRVSLPACTLPLLIRDVVSETKTSQAWQ